MSIYKLEEGREGRREKKRKEGKEKREKKKKDKRKKIGFPPFLSPFFNQTLNPL